MNSIMMLAGLVLLLGGGEALVRGGVALATRMRLPMAVVGAVVLGFGTSMPELLTSLSAAWAGAPGIAVGNVVGSNIANILLILGIAALIAAVPGETATVEDRLWLLVATLLGLAILILRPVMGRVEGAILLVALAVYLWRALSRDSGAEPVPGIAGLTGWRIAGLVLIGLGALMAGAWLLVTGATGIARALGVSETVIGLTVVAVGTSLPELATSVIAARRGEAGLALGNIIGSNVFNIFAILGLTAVIFPIPVPPDLGLLDLALFAASAILLLALLATGRISRSGGALLLAPYASYVAWLAVGAPDVPAATRRSEDRMPRALARRAKGASFAGKRWSDPMPDHIKLILRHAFFGFLIALAFVGGLLALNVANLWHLVTHTAEGPIAVLMLIVFCTITFGSVQIGYKIMSMGEENDDEPRGGKRDAIRVLDAIPVPVRNEAPSRHRR
jgi:cation:H+ antiporter